MSLEFQFDVFLSHSSKDKIVVRGLAGQLRADGLRVWLDEWEIKLGDSIPAKIEEGLEHSRVLVLCMSANAFGSDWAQFTLGGQGYPFRNAIRKRATGDATRHRALNTSTSLLPNRRFIIERIDFVEISYSLLTCAFRWRLPCNFLPGALRFPVRGR